MYLNLYIYKAGGSKETEEGDSTLHEKSSSHLLILLCTFLAAVAVASVEDTYTSLAALR
jgi:hypothetical protein